MIACGRILAATTVARPNGREFGWPPLARSPMRDIAASRSCSHSPRSGQQLRALCCQGNMAGGAIEQSESELILELADQQAEPGWCNEERLGSPREILMLRHQKKRAQLARGEIDH